jgi:TolA-binding protein
MTEKDSRASHAVEDLSLLARRGALSRAQQRAFAELLESNATLATAHQVGLDFDQVAAVKPGDDALIAEALARVVSRGRVAKPVRSRWRLRLLLLAATLTLAGSAVGWWQHARATRPAPPAVAQTSQKPSAVGAPRVTSAAAANASTAPEMPAQPPQTSASAAAIASPRLAAPSAASDAPSARTFDSAEAVFREANAARRAGDSSRARALYLRLQRDFPASDEALLAHVSLGNLLLTMGRAAEAERQFASYLGGRPALAQEALVGRAQSLAALGRSADERRVWEGLIREYPNSVYAARARRRLAELTSSTVSPN